MKVFSFVNIIMNHKNCFVNVFFVVLYYEKYTQGSVCFVTTPVAESSKVADGRPGFIQHTETTPYSLQLVSQMCGYFQFSPIKTNVCLMLTLCLENTLGASARLQFLAG
jgi:hypothetical protein